MAWMAGVKYVLLGNGQWKVVASPIEFLDEDIGKDYVTVVGKENLRRPKEFRVRVKVEGSIYPDKESALVASLKLERDSYEYRGNKKINVG